MQKSGSGTSIGVDSDRESVVAGSDGDYAAAMENVPHGGLERRMPRTGSRENLENMLRDDAVRDKIFQMDATQVLEEMIGDVDTTSSHSCALRPVASKLDILSELLEIGHTSIGANAPWPECRRTHASGDHANRPPAVHEAQPVSVANLRPSNGGLQRVASSDQLRDDSQHSYASKEGNSTGDDDEPAAMEEIIAVCINKVCKRRKFGLGNIWIVAGGRLVCAPTYQTVATLSEKLQFFGDRCREISFAPGEGLPGRTWTSMTEEWIVNVQDLSLSEYPRLEIAKACGVQTSFTVPFVVCGVVLAVCEFVVARQIRYDAAIIQEIKTALSEALQLKVHLGLQPLQAGADGRNTASKGKRGLAAGKGGGAPEDPSDKYMRQPLYLRAVSEQWTIPRHEIQLMGTIGEGEEGVVYKGQWRMMPVVGLVWPALRMLRS
jgi:hypothetical protein